VLAISVSVLVVALADLAACGISGVPRRRPLNAVALAAVLAGAALGLPWLGLSAAAGWSLFGLTAAAALGWLGLRLRPDSAGLAGGALAVLSLYLVVLVGASGALWADARAPALERWLGTLVTPELVDAGAFVALAAAVGFSVSTASGVVRCTLAAAGPIRVSADRFRGGRTIGVIERLMILGLVLSGNATAAALVVSAKSLLRFPEVSRQQQREGEGGLAQAADVSTEYFLLGSMASWMCALAAAGCALLALGAG
jgi:hypothetical protein